MPGGQREVPFTSLAARLLSTISVFLMAVGTFLLTAQETPWDIDVSNIGLAINWAAIILQAGVIALRSNAVPGITSGIALDAKPGPTETTTTP